MQQHSFGRTGLKVSALGFGCGSVGGLMVRGTAADQERAFARAIEASITYFDTASQYGDGVSEQTLGRLYRQMKPRDFAYGTKVRLRDNDRANIRAAIAQSLDASLERLGFECADILHLHNGITQDGRGDTLTAGEVLGEVVAAFEDLKRQGKIGWGGITAVGDTPEILKVIESGAVDSAQVCYNLLNPSAATALPAHYPAQDYGRLLDHAVAAGTGIIGIRVLAGGALSGASERHPNASPPPRPIGSAADFDTDAERTRLFMPLIADGVAASLSELAIRFAMSQPTIGTALIGIASIDELDQAIAAAEKGPLTQRELDAVAAIQSNIKEPV